MFKVGDRVRILHTEDQGWGGYKGTVLYQYNDTYDYNVLVDNPDKHTVPFHKHELELDKHTVVKEIIKDLL